MAISDEIPQVENDIEGCPQIVPYQRLAEGDDNNDDDVTPAGTHTSHPQQLVDDQVVSEISDELQDEIGAPSKKHHPERLSGEITHNDGERKGLMGIGRDGDD